MKRAPGAQRGEVVVRAIAHREGDSLEAELEGALVDALGGEPASRGTMKTLERVARAILLRRGMGAARVVVEPAIEGFTVHVVMPPGPARVGSVRVSVQGGNP